MLLSSLDEEAAPTARASQRECERNVDQHRKNEDSKYDVIHPVPRPPVPRPRRVGGEGDRYRNQAENEHHPDGNREPTRDDRESRHGRSLGWNHGHRDITLAGARRMRGHPLRASLAGQDGDAALGAPASGR
jgi:hypothetical protein